jgi:hypothetical protein
MDIEEETSYSSSSSLTSPSTSSEEEEEEEDLSSPSSPNPVSSTSSHGNNRLVPMPTYLAKSSQHDMYRDSDDIDSYYRGEAGSSSRGQGSGGGGETAGPAKPSPSVFKFSPFPKYSVNIVTGPTFVGKTYFITQLVNQYKTYFESPVGRVVVVLCNSRVKSIVFDADLDVPVVQVLLTDFVPDHLEDNDLVIIDDLQHLTPEVKLTISVCAHHQSLAALFVVTHSLLGSKNFELLSLCHRIFLFLGSTANNRLTAFILDRFYSDPSVKTYLKTVLNFCASENEILALELSPVGHSPQVVLAFSHLWHLKQQQPGRPTFCLLYPSPHFGEKFAQRFASPSRAPILPDTTATMSISFLHSDSSSKLPANTLIALPAQFVIDQNIASGGSGSSSSNGGSEDSDKKAHECADRDAWEATLEDIEENIESFFPMKRWKVCKNLAKEILSNPNFCITNDGGKYFHLKDKANTKVNMLSFLGLVTRKAGPTEKTFKPEWKMYAPHIRQLLNNGAPKELFVNRLLLQERQRRQPARRRGQDL